MLSFVTVQRRRPARGPRPAVVIVTHDQSVARRRDRLIRPRDRRVVEGTVLAPR